MTQSVFDYIENNSKIQALIKRSVSPSLYDDFKSDLYLNLLEIKNNKLQEAWTNDNFIGGNNTDWLVVRLVLNGRGSESKFYRMYRSKNRLYTNIENEGLDFEYKTDIKERKEKEELLTQIQLILTDISYTDKLLFMKYYFDGIKMAQLARELGYSYSTVRKSVKSTFSYLKNKLNDYDDHNFDDFDLNS